MSCSKNIVKKIFLDLESKVERQPVVKGQYVKCMDDYINLKHMEKIENIDDTSQLHFLPYHSVVKPESSSTKLRMFFGASCNSDSEYSLNYVLMVRPVIQHDLFTILLGFRMFKFAVTADICKMYGQIQVRFPDNLYQCIFCRESSQNPLEVYCLLTITYDTAPASF